MGGQTSFVDRLRLTTIAPLALSFVFLLIAPLALSFVFLLGRAAVVAWYAGGRIWGKTQSGGLRTEVREHRAIMGKYVFRVSP